MGSINARVTLVPHADEMSNAIDDNSSVIASIYRIIDIPVAILDTVRRRNPQYGQRHDSYHAERF